MIDTRLLVFYKAAQRLSFSEAAQELLLTQPAVTFQIKKLEQTLGTRLFYRDKNRVTLTEAGELLYQHAGRILAAYEEAQRALHGLTGLVTGRLVIGASTTMGEYILPRVLGRFQARHPEVQTALEIGNSHRILHGVTSRYLDLGILAEEVTHRELAQEAILKDELVLIVSPSNPLSRRPEVSLKELSGQRFVIRERGSGTRQTMEQALRRAGLDPGRLKVALRLGSSEAVKAAVEADLGVAVLSRWTLAKELRLGTLVVVPIRGLRITRDFKLIHYRSAAFPVSVRALMTFLREYPWHEEG